MIEVVQGDITRLAVDAIVNAANASLLGGGGVDGAIHRAAGPELLAECRSLGGCPTGEARITRAYRLPARYVIHTVGPVWRGGKQGEADLLACCYRSSLKLASDYDLVSIAFPAISTGVYGYPKDEACRIAINAVTEYMREETSVQKVVFACFSAGDRDIYKETLQRRDAV
jgi:O-acetyl-ADP-ribose deacetylase (regulator of RNase III)